MSPNPAARKQTEQMQALRQDPDGAKAPSVDARFRLLFDAHHHDILRYCYRRVNREAAHEIASQTFVVAWRRLDEVPQGVAALTWLYAVARNLVANERRAQARKSRLVGRLLGMGDSAPDGPEEVALRSVPDPRVLRALRRLRPGDRDLLRMVAWEQHPRPEIARILGTTRKTLDQRIRRALQRLRTELEHEGLTTPELTAPRVAEEGGER